MRTQSGDLPVFNFTALNQPLAAVAILQGGQFYWHAVCKTKAFVAVSKQGVQMGQRVTIRKSAQAPSLKSRTKPAPSRQELARLYYELQYLRQKVHIAESRPTVKGEVTHLMVPAVLP